MAGKGTDRKGKGKEAKGTNDMAETLAAFALPDSLPCSEVNFPVLIRKVKRTSWNEILDESKREQQEIEEYVESKREPALKAPFLKTENDYINDEVFVYLLPALEETLNKAKIWGALESQKCFFNGIDHIVQELWNNNPRYPGRKDINAHLFNMTWVRALLQSKCRYFGLVPKAMLERYSTSRRNDVTVNIAYAARPTYRPLCPRPFYPKSWLWPEDYAATLIQKSVRQYFVQREDEVQEMRDFWKKLKIGRKIPSMIANPMLAKKFASAQTSHLNESTK